MQHVVTDPSHPYADFRNFLYVVWKYLNLPDPTPVQYDIAWNLQHGPTRYIVEAFRGVGKSFITAAFVCWLLWWSPNLKILVVSASKDRADAFSQFVLRLICDMPELKHLTPRSNQRRSLIAFDVNGATPDQSPSVKSVGITGQLTGSRADVIIGDDVETPKNSQTQMQREKLGEQVKEFDAILKPLPGSRILYLGTPQCEDSLYNELVKRGYTAMIWPARMPADISKYVGKLAPYIAELTLKPGSTTDPRRFTDADLANREASYGRTGFALQFMLDTSLSDALKYPLKCSDFIVADIDREVAPVKITWASGEDQQLDLPCVGLKGDRWFGPMYVSKDHAQYQGAVLFIDPSGKGADRTAFAVVKMLNGMLFVRRCGSLAGGFDDSTMMTLANIARNEKVTEVMVEENFGGGMFAALLKPHLTRIYPCTVSEVFVTKQKELRIIDTLEPVLNQHRLVLDKAIIAGDMALDPEHQLLHQLTRITKERNALSHDDQIDALAGAVAYWVERMDVDQSDSEERHNEAMLDLEIAKFMEHAMGGQWANNGPNWTNTV